MLIERSRENIINNKNIACFYSYDVRKKNRTQAEKPKRKKRADMHVIPDPGRRWQISEINMNNSVMSKLNVNLVHTARHSPSC